MENTYLPIFRGLLTSKQFHNPVCLKIWVWCLMKANIEENQIVVGRQVVKVKPGQFIFGRLTASEQLDIPPSTIWFWMKWLQEDESLDIKSNNKYSIITICKWKKYQDIIDSRLSNRRKTNEKQTDTEKEGKEGKEILSTNVDNKPALIYGNSELNEIIKYFETILMPVVSKHKFNRYALSNLLKKHGKDKVQGFIRAARAAAEDRYAPSIASPLDLQEKLPQLILWIKKQTKKGAPSA